LAVVPESVFMDAPTDPPKITPDEKDWTVVITDGCAQCGFSAQVDVTRTGDLVRASVPVWQEALARDDARQRPTPTTWSPLEYACHVRDVCRVFLGRLDLMLTDDPARFANWDGEAAAVQDRYHAQDPVSVAAEYESAARALAEAFDRVEGAQWQRRGLRGDGYGFTVESFARYLLHELHHHAGDV